MLFQRSKLTLLNFISASIEEVLKESSKLPTIRFEHHASNETFPIHFDGVPYIFLGKREYRCHQGHDIKGKLIKKKYQEKRRQLLCGDHPEYIKTRKLTQPTKKLDCPVQFQVKKIIRFPEFRIESDTKWNRTVASKKIKSYFAELSKIKHGEGIEVIKNESSDHSERTIGKLEYITRFPTGMSIQTIII